MTTRRTLRTSAYILTAGALGACMAQEPKRAQTPASGPQTTTESSESTGEKEVSRPPPEAPSVATAQPEPTPDDGDAAPREEQALAGKADKKRPVPVAPAKPATTPPAQNKQKSFMQSTGGDEGVEIADRFADTGGERGNFEGREITFNAPTKTAEDALSTFAIDVDTAAYSIARRSLRADRMPTGSLVRVEEFINYFRYAYEPPSGDRNLFSIQADGAEHPTDRTKHILRVGIQARVVEESERLPANLVFLFDTSCSMTSQDRLELAKKSLLMAVDRLGPKDKVAITTYAGGVSLVLPPTSGDDKQRIKRAIRGLEPGGGTAMQDGLELAYRQASAMQRPNSITRIIVCSDGDANIGLATPEQILARIEGYVKEGVTISTIGYGDGNYKDEMMEKLANRGNGNYYYIDSERQAERVFSRDLTKMLQDVAQDVKIQVEMNPTAVKSYRLLGYENRDIADRDFRNDKVDAGEIGAGHQVTAVYELDLVEGAKGNLATVRVRAKEPGRSTAKEVALEVPASVVDRAFIHAPDDLRFAAAVVGGAELLRQSPHARGWSFARVMEIVAGTDPSKDPDRAEFLALMKKAAQLTGEGAPVGMR
jgi:Ca-activated chloride channel homolog